MTTNERTLARSVMYNIEDTTGRRPRADSIWPAVVGWSLVLLVVLLCAGRAAAQILAV